MRNKVLQWNIFREIKIKMENIGDSSNFDLHGTLIKNSNGLIELILEDTILIKIHDVSNNSMRITKKHWIIWLNCLFQNILDSQSTESSNLHIKVSGSEKW